MAKIQPAQRVLTYTVTPSSGTVSFTLDLAKDLSAVNRRLYRQGMQYHVSSVRVTRADTGISGITVKTAGDTWMVHNAWKKGFKMWKHQRAEIQEQLPGLSGKWADFKVELSDDSPSPLNTIASDGGTIVPDEWEMSEVFWEDDGTEYSPSFCLIGASNALPPTTKASLVQEYHISRTIPQAQEPRISNDASQSIYALVNADMEGDLSEDLILDISGDNDASPYDSDEMVGGDTVADCPFVQDFVVASFAGGTASTVPFTAECGLVHVDLGSFQADGSTASDVAHIITVHLTPGNYKGVLAAPMGQ